MISLASGPLICARTGDREWEGPERGSDRPRLVPERHVGVLHTEQLAPEAFRHLVAGLDHAASGRVRREQPPVEQHARVRRVRWHLPRPPKREPCREHRLVRIRVERSEPLTRLLGLSRGTPSPTWRRRRSSSPTVVGALGIRGLAHGVAALERAAERAADGGEDAGQPGEPHVVPDVDRPVERAAEEGVRHEQGGDRERPMNTPRRACLSLSRA